MFAAATNMSWLAEVKRSLTSDFGLNSPATLGILAFDAAKTMARLVSLYKTLSDHEFHSLRNNVMRSKGVSYLNSKDQGYLIYLACVEILESLDSAAVAVTRHGRKCRDFGLSRFDSVYRDLKMGRSIDASTKLKLTNRNTGKVIEKMERLVHATAELHRTSEALSEMEFSERKLLIWKKNAIQKTNFDLFDEKIAYQRKQVRQLKDSSLWGQTFDKAVGLMARGLCIVYTRACRVFAPYMSIFPHRKFLSYHDKGGSYESGPTAAPPKKRLVHALFTRKICPPAANNICFGSGCDNEENMGRQNSAYLGAPPSTVGGSRLALRYANVIILSEQYLNAAAIGEKARKELYQMLPESLKAAVRSKLRRQWNKEEEKETAAAVDGESMAEGWREAMKDILGWLGPMAHDTVTWNTVKVMEKKMFDGKPAPLLLQTLHYSDRERTEAAMVEVLVGLSCMYRYENRRVFDHGCRNSPIDNMMF